MTVSASPTLLGRDSGCTPPERPDNLCHATSVCFDPDSARAPSHCAFEDASATRHEPLRRKRENCLHGQPRTDLAGRIRAQSLAFLHGCRPTRANLLSKSAFPMVDGIASPKQTPRQPPALLADNGSPVFLRELDVASLSQTSTLCTSPPPRERATDDRLSLPRGVKLCIAQVLVQRFALHRNLTFGHSDVPLVCVGPDRPEMGSSVSFLNTSSR